MHSIPLFPIFLLLLMSMVTFSFKRSINRPLKQWTKLKLRNTFNLRMSTESASKPDFQKYKEEKYFNFQQGEMEIYDWWEKSGYFKPSDSTKKPFVVSMPPPNVTGYLHMGHALFVALEDIMTRFQRMRGRPTLWLPGTDHAGIATQLLVERKLNEEGTSRKELGREKFLERVWEWKEEKGGYIFKQMRRLGASADWSREKFTLDQHMNEAVLEAFVQLHEKGLIYRGNYMVNWSPNLQTAVSDLEVDYTEEQGKLYYFKYELEGDLGFIPVATTRPETILGDTAVCVHPEDPRFKEFVGKRVKVPMMDRLIPVIADEYVDREFGTGALKITPAHDTNDYELGKKHNLPLINIMNKDATINENGGKYKGLDRFACREEIWKDLSESGIALEAKPHLQRVPRSQRGGEIIEPLVSAQWFVRTENMGKRAVDVVKNKDITILPERFEKVWFNWLENIHDWCISRQLWWGHRIPVYYVMEESSSNTDPEYIVAKSLEEAKVKAKAKYGKAVSLVQDDDVLDTWFSSGLWPFATMGWPQQLNDKNLVVGNAAPGDLERFYPGSVLETGYDILFFWVARMVMLGLELTDKSPFHTIYLHGLVRDAEGQKMSKTKGNVIDPLETIDNLGSDALRYSLVTGSTPGQDIPLSMEKVESNRNFANKLWNAGKFIDISISGMSENDLLTLSTQNSITQEELQKLPVVERYIISRCHQLVEKVTNYLEDYNFGEAGRLIYEFLWDEFADWYIEISKTRMKNNSEEAKMMTRRVLVYTWDSCLRLLHPFMPFLTESLWQFLPQKTNSIMIAPWPQEENEKLSFDETAISTFSKFQNLVRSIRNARAEYNVDAGKKIDVILKVSSDFEEFLNKEKEAFALLARAEISSLKILPLTTEDPLSELGPCVHLIVEEGVEAFLPQSGLIDKEKEQKRLSKQSEKLQKDINVLEGRLKSKGFVDKAPTHLVDEVKQKLSDLKEQLKSVESSLETLSV